MTTLDIATAVAAQRGAGDVREIGQGSNNTVFAAAGRDGKCAIKLSKPHRDAGALSEFRKEVWCAREARRRGVNTPEILDVGVLDGCTFAVQCLVDGRAPAVADETAVWRVLGEAARRIHVIPVEGWSVNMAADGVFAGSWQGQIAYNIGSLSEDDPLRALGVLNAASSERLKRSLEGLAVIPFRFGLCHGDLALSNTLVDANGVVWLLDWGSAAAYAAPHYDINEILRGPKPNADNMNAFLEGYGLSRDDFAAMQPDLRALAALREVDTLRWAIEKQPDMIAQLTETARAAVAALG